MPISEKTTDLPQVTDKLVEYKIIEIKMHNKVGNNYFLAQPVLFMN
jgi:hypothetical protein